MSSTTTTSTTTTSAPSGGTSSPMIKPLIGAAAAFCIDTFGFGNTNQQSAMMLAGGIGASLFIAPYVSNFLPFESTLSSIGTDGGVSAEARIVECGVALGSTYLIEEYVLKNGFHKDEISRKLMVIVASDFISTYAAEYLSGQALQFVKGTGI